MGALRVAGRGPSIREAVRELSSACQGPGSLQEVLGRVRDELPGLLGAERVTVFALDLRQQQLHSLIKGGDELREIRVGRDTRSIAGFTSQSRQRVNLRDAYDAVELARRDPDLRFDGNWDARTGFRTRQVCCVPVLREGQVLGVLQALNKVGAERFTETDEELLVEIAGGLAVALYNQRRLSRQQQPDRLGLLVDRGLLTETQLEEARAFARQNGEGLDQVIIGRFGVPRSEVGEALEVFYGVPFFDWNGTQEIPVELRKQLNHEFLAKTGCAPLARAGGVTTVAMADPSDQVLLEQVRSLELSPRYAFCVGLGSEILACIRASYHLPGPKDFSVPSTEEVGPETEPSPGRRTEPASPPDLEDNLVIRLASQIIRDAVRRGASDIHIEPRGPLRPCVVRYRIDGDCEPVMEVPATLSNAVVSRLKIMARLDISERRRPQDGKLLFHGASGPVELRVACVPTAEENEDVVMRVLPSGKPRSLDALGLSARDLAGLQVILAKPYGLFLCVGPTGSGKTTTLHSCLGSLNTPDTKIWTIEDPIEITQDGLRQVEVNRAKDLTFATAMRAFLRADPDVIMVGEMRDRETAAIGVEASLTGHLVLSTLHTNSAPETVGRLLNLDLDPFNFAEALQGVLAQRLARMLCERCKQAYRPTLAELDELRTLYGEEAWGRAGKALLPSGGPMLFRAVGCPECHQRGYRGRLGLYELLIGSQALRRLIVERRPVEHVRKLAIEEGMTTLFQDGIHKVLQGRMDLKSVRVVCTK